MNRKYNTTRTGNGFSPATIEAVWRKAKPIAGRPGYAKDICGATIQRLAYGKLIATGFEIDHITPVSRGGSDDLSNLQPLQWQNNRSKSDKPNGTWVCTVRT